MSWVAAGVAVVGIGTSVYKGIKAGKEKKKNEEALNSLSPSFYKIQDEYNQNKNIAASNASTGLPDSTKNYLTTESQRGLGSSLGFLNQSSEGGSNDAGRLFDTYLRSIDRTAAEDAQMKLNNINNFMNANKELAGQKTMQWTLNELRPYERKLKQFNNNIAAEKTNQNNALNEGIGYASSFGTAMSNSGLMNNLFSNNSDYGNVDTLQYNQPTTNVAQPNPTSFQAPQQGTWAAGTDINGNPLYTTPQRPM